MRRTLLAERFHLVVHREPRETQVLVMTVTDAVKLYSLKEGTAPSMKDFDALGVLRPLDDPTRAASGNGLMAVHGTMSEFAESLSVNPEVGRPVVDRSGLEGQYIFALRWYQGDLLPDLQEKYGLKFQSEKKTIDVLVIDKIERPTGN